AEHPGMRTYVLAADTLEDLRGWLRALGRASRAEGDDCGQPRLSAQVSRGEEGRGSESPEVARLSRGRGRLLTPSPMADLQSGPRIRRTRSPDRIDVRPPLDWGPQRQTLSRPPTPRRGPSSEAGGGRDPRSPQHWSQEARTPPGPPLDSTFHQSLETDTLLTKLCGQDRLLRRLQEEIDQRQEEKEQLEAALELTRQQLGQTTREAAAPGRAWGRQRLLQDRLVSVRAALCHLTQDRASAQQQLWMVEDTLAGLGGPQKPPHHTDPDSPSPALQGEESLERESLPESLELSLPRSPEADWGRPPGGDRELASPRSGLGSPRVSRASSPEGRRPPSPQPGTKVPLARPRMSAQEQLERMRRHQEYGRPLPRPASPRLLTLGRTLSPAGRQPEAEQKVRETEQVSRFYPACTCAEISILAPLSVEDR
ncbi:hypothetical protein E2I00_006442, partial [Balaenoptera physalus]